jgi:hypothetical protein
MVSQSFQDKKSELETAFNNLEAEKTQLNERLNEITASQLKLQGAFNLLNELSDEPNKKGTKDAK